MSLGTSFGWKWKQVFRSFGVVNTRRQVFFLSKIILARISGKNLKTNLWKKKWRRKIGFGQYKCSVLLIHIDQNSFCLVKFLPDLAAHLMFKAPVHETPFLTTIMYDTVVYKSSEVCPDSFQLFTNIINWNLAFRRGKMLQSEHIFDHFNV